MSVHSESFDCDVLASIFPVAPKEVEKYTGVRLKMLCSV